MSAPGVAPSFEDALAAELATLRAAIVALADAQGLTVNLPAPFAGMYRSALVESAVQAAADVAAQTATRLTADLFNQLAINAGASVTHVHMPTPPPMNRRIEHNADGRIAAIIDTPSGAA